MWWVFLVFLMGCGHPVVLTRTATPEETRWQQEMTKRMNAVTACLSLEQQQCIDQKESGDAKPH